MKLYFIRFLLVSYILVQTHDKAFAISTSPADYFRSSASGTWNAISSWESSADGTSNWTPATLVPTTSANTVTIRSGHTISINSNTTIDQVVVANGGILELATGSSTQLSVNDDSGKRYYRSGRRNFQT